MTETPRSGCDLRPEFVPQPPLAHMSPTLRHGMEAGGTRPQGLGARRESAATPQAEAAHRYLEYTTTCISGRADN